eukprot:gene4203-8363_t
MKFFNLLSALLMGQQSTCALGLRNKVTFSVAELRGEEYIRPFGASAMHNIENVDYSSNCNVEQVHITLGNKENSIIISYVSTSTLFINSFVYYSTDPNALLSVHSSADGVKMASGKSYAYSSLISVSSSLINPAMGTPPATAEEVIAIENTANWAYDPITKQKYANWMNVTEVSYGSMAYNNPKAIYDSPLIHTVVLESLESSQVYFYRPKGSCKVYTFTSPFYYSSSQETAAKAHPSPYPMRIGVLADLGQTRVSEASLAAIAAMDPHLVLLVGDLSYADGWPWLWDSFGRMISPTFANVPLLTATGNHELGSGESWQHYEARYPTPHRYSQSPSPTYWAREIGAMHVVALNPYAGTANTSRQYRWLEGHLRGTLDRGRTPWLVVMLHAPWYNTNEGHWKESESMRTDMEELLYTFGVDVVLAGHVHVYERTHPVYKEALDVCGPTYFTVGDGGNYEYTYVPWRLPPSVWSAFRESSFGVSGISIVNDTHAHFQWHRHACGSDSNAPDSRHMNFSESCVTPGDNSDQRMLTSDSHWIVRPGAATCANRHMGVSSSSASVPSGATVKAPRPRPRPTFAKDNSHRKIGGEGG